MQGGSGWVLTTFGPAESEDLPLLVAESARIAAAMQLA
jgi:hypothetical protein